MKKRIIKIIFLLVIIIVLLPYIHFWYQKYSYPVEMYLEPLEIEYDFTKPGITLEEVQEMNGNQAKIEYLEGDMVPYIINGVITNQKISSIEEALSVLYEYRDIFKIKEFEYIGVINEEEDGIYYSFFQHKNGVRVKDGNFSVVTTMTGEVKRIGGRYFNVSGINTTPVLSYKECWKINKDFFKGIRKEKVKLLICKFKGSTELCWQYDVSDKHGRNRQTVYVSALDGDIVWISADGTA